MPLQFAWEDLRTEFFEFDAGHGYDRSMPYMFGICLFFEIFFFGNPGYCRILHRYFWLMQMDLCLDLELGMWNYLRMWNEKKVSPTRIRLQLRPCHPGQHGHYTMLQLLMGSLSFGNRKRHVNLLHRARFR